MIANGGFRGSVTGWVLAHATYYGTEGQNELGCVRLEPTVGAAASIVQSFGGPGSDPLRMILVRLALAAKQLSGVCPQDLRVRLYDALTTSYLDRSFSSPTWGTWLRIELSVYVPENTWLTVDISTAAGAPGGNYWLVDDVVLQPAIPFPGSVEGMALELRKRRQDLAATKHPPVRYRELVSQACREAPMALWQLVTDESLETVEEVRLYSLGAIPRLVEPHQMGRVFVADTDDHPVQVGRWEIQRDEAGGLVLAFDTDPAGERSIRLEYLAPWPEPDPDDWSEESGLDREWVLCKAMTLLLMEAAVEDRDPRMHIQELASWDAKRQAREAQAGRRRRAGKTRTQDWSRI